jgi:hypothetical protein
MTAGSFYAQPFDERALTVSGEPVTIPGRMLVEGSVASANAEASDGGLVFRSDPPKLRRLVWIDRNGRELSDVGKPQEYHRSLSISPDGRQAIVGRRNPEKGEDELWTIDLERGTEARSGSGVEEEGSPVWSQDGTRFVLNWDREGPYDLVIRYADGSKPDEVVLHSAYDKIPDDWSRDGRFILFHDYDPNNPGLSILSIGSSAPPAHVKGSERAHGFRLSPDGRWLLWVSPESGRREVYVQRFPDGSGRQQVSVNGGAACRWSADGKEILFIAPDTKLMSASFDENGGSPRIGIPSALFAMTRAQMEDAYPGSQGTAWDAAPDGKRFLMFVPTTPTDPLSITVVLNWAAQLAK